MAFFVNQATFEPLLYQSIKRVSSLTRSHVREGIMKLQACIEGCKGGRIIQSKEDTLATFMEKHVILPCILPHLSRKG